jgi:hypothetical protein
MLCYWTLPYTLCSHSMCSHTVISAARQRLKVRCLQRVKWVRDHQIRFLLRSGQSHAARAT